MTSLTLMRLTLTEMWRQRMALIPTVLACLMLSLGFIELTDPPAATLPMAEQLTHEIPWALATQVLPGIGMFLGMLAGAGIIANEIERGTMLLLASKPISRWGLVLSKAAGAFAFLFAGFAVWGLILGALWAFKTHIGVLPPIWAATVLGCLPACLFAAIAIAASTRVPAMAASSLAFLAFVSNLVATGILNLGEVPFFERIKPLAYAIKRAVPSEKLGEVGNYVALGTPLTADHGWALLAIAGWLAVAVALFQRRDLN